MARRITGHHASAGLTPTQGPRVSTYQTRIADYGSVNRAVGDAALDAYAELYGRVEHKLFADVAADRSASSLKSAYLERYGIPARMFNAVRVLLEGKVASVGEQQKLRLDSLQRRIARAERQLSDAAEHGRFDQVHQKKRRLVNLRHRLFALEADVAAGRVRLCFGSKRLWRKQHHLAENGYGSHREWLSDWREARSNEFFVLGSRDETAGCQLCVASIADDGTLTLRLRMPDCLAEQHGKYLVMQGVRFAYGHEQVLAALGSNAEYAAYRREHGEKAARATELGQAISYRFKRDDRGWRVFATTDMMDVPVVTDQRHGVIGVDLNADHLAVAETDASGNYVNAWRVSLVTYGLQDPPVVLHRVVSGHLAGVLEAQDLGEAQVGVRRAVGWFRMLGLDGETGVVAGQEVLQHRRGLVDVLGISPAEFDYQPVLEGPRRPFHPALGLRRAGEDLPDPQLLQASGELGGFRRGLRLAGVVLEYRVAVAVER